MKHLNPKEKLEFILEISKKNDVKAYEIEKNTELTEAGIRRILDGTTKRPHINTINSIYNFLLENYTEHAEPKMDVVENGNDKLRDALLEHKDEIKGNFTNLMETIIKKVIAKETGKKFQSINENILTIFRKQMDLDMELKKIHNNLDQNDNKKIN